MKKAGFVIFCVCLVIIGLFLGYKVDKAAKSTATYFEDQTPFKINEQGITLLNTEFKF